MLDLETEEAGAAALPSDWEQRFGPEGGWQHKGCNSCGSYIIFHFPDEDPRHASWASCSYCSARWSAANDWRRTDA